MDAFRKSAYLPEVLKKFSLKFIKTINFICEHSLEI